MTIEVVFSFAPGDVVELKDKKEYVIEWCILNKNNSYSYSVTREMSPHRKTVREEEIVRVVEYDTSYEEVANG